MGCRGSKIKKEVSRTLVSGGDGLKQEPKTTSLPGTKDKKPNKIETKTKDKQNQIPPVSGEVKQCPIDSQDPKVKSYPNPKPNQERKGKVASAIKLPKKYAKIVINDDRPLTQAKGLANKCWWDNDNDDVDENDKPQDEIKEPTKTNYSPNGPTVTLRKYASPRKPQMDSTHEAASDQADNAVSPRVNTIRKTHKADSSYNNHAASGLLGTRSENSGLGNSGTLDFSGNDSDVSINGFKENKSPVSRITTIVDRRQQDFSPRSSNYNASDEVTLEDVEAYEQRITPRRREVNWGFTGDSLPFKARETRNGNIFNNACNSNGEAACNGRNVAYGGKVSPFDKDLSSTTSPPISSPYPKFKRPAPLKRGAGAAAVRRPVQPIGPTKASVEKILEKLCSLDDSRWSELIKAHTELCNTAQKHQSILLQCDQKLFLNTVKQVTVHTNSGRSNVSKHGLMCLGLLFKVFKDQLTPVLNDALCACIKRTASSSNEFITKASTIALMQICTASSADKIIPLLLHRYNIQKSFQIPVLQALLMVINGIQGDIGQIKCLNDVVKVTVKSLIAANATVRTFSRNLLGVLDGKCDLQAILQTMHLSPDNELNVNTVLSKYKEEEKNKLIGKLLEGT